MSYSISSEKIKVVVCNNCFKENLVYAFSKTNIYCPCGKQIIKTTGGKSKIIV